MEVSEQLWVPKLTSWSCDKFQSKLSTIPVVATVTWRETHSTLCMEPFRSLSCLLDCPLIEITPPSKSSCDGTAKGNLMVKLLYCMSSSKKLHVATKGFSDILLYTPRLGYSLKRTPKLEYSNS